MKKLIQIFLITIVCFQFNCDLTSSKDDDSTTDTPTPTEPVYEAMLENIWFIIDGKVYDGIVDPGDYRSIRVDEFTGGILIPYSYPLTDLIAHFEVSEGAKVYVNGVEQVSGVTVNDFTNPLPYRIVSKDGKKESINTLTVSWLENKESKLYSMSVLVGTSEYVCDVSETNKTVSVNIADKIKSELTTVKFRFVISGNGMFLIGGTYGVVITSEVTSVDISSTYGVTPITIKADNINYKTDYTFTRTCSNCSE